MFANLHTLFVVDDAGLPTLAQLVSPGATTESYTLFLDLLSLLLTLDATTALGASQSHHSFVLQSYITLLTLPKPQDAAARTGAVQLLGSFLAQLSGEDMKRLVPALEQVVQDFGVEMPKDRWVCSQTLFGWCMRFAGW
jgi:hypothetical protein